MSYNGGAPAPPQRQEDRERRRVRPVLDAGLPPPRPQPRPRLRDRCAAELGGRSWSTRGCASTTPGPRGGCTTSSSRACADNAAAARSAGAQLLALRGDAGEPGARPPPRARAAGRRWWSPTISPASSCPGRAPPSPGGRRCRSSRWTRTRSCPCRCWAPPVGAAAHLRPAHPQGVRRGLGASRRAASPRSPRRPAKAVEAALRDLEGGRRRGLRARPSPGRHGARRCAAMPGGGRGGQGAAAPVPEEAAARATPRPARAPPPPERRPRQRALALPALRPHLHRGGGRGGPRDHGRVDARTSCASTTAGKREGFFADDAGRERASSTRPSPGATWASSGTGSRRDDTAVPRDGRCPPGRSRPCAPTPATSARTSTRPRSGRRAPPTTRSGTRRSASSWPPAPSTTTCACSGARRSSSGRGRPDEAYATLVHLNNKYALDGRDPNSYTGILWCFGLFDRPWAPERKVLGRAPLHVVGEHRAQVQARALLRVRERPAHHRGRAPRRALLRVLRHAFEAVGQGISPAVCLGLRRRSGTRRWPDRSPGRIRRSSIRRYMRKSPRSDHSG